MISLNLSELEVPLFSFYEYFYFISTYLLRAFELSFPSCFFKSMPKRDFSGCSVLLSSGVRDLHKVADFTMKVTSEGNFPIANLGISSA